jgi:hypothetical protein
VGGGVGLGVSRGRLEGIHLGQRLGQLFLDGGRFGIGYRH